MHEFIIENLPFGIGCFSEADESMPSFLPFQLHFDEASGFISQDLGDRSRMALKFYYSKGGYASTPLGEGEYGKRQGAELLLQIKSCLADLNRNIGELSFLEIGASYGYLLYLLFQAGAKEVVGLEPGNEGVVGGKKYGVKLIRDFFPSDNLEKKFDFIYCYAVLEHIENPLDFIEAMVAQSEENGIVFIGVPDCAKKMELGDFSIVSHQHINYFTKDSLERLLKICGLTNIHISSSKERSLLIGYGVKKNIRAGSRHPSENMENISAGRNLLESFRDNFQKNISTLQGLIDKYENNGKSIGFYAPGLNIVGLLQMKKTPRIFDGDAVKTGKYINGCASAFETPDDLLKKPVDVLFVCPIDYDQEIIEGLMTAGLDKDKTVLISLKGIYEANSGMKYGISSLINDYRKIL